MRLSVEADHPVEVLHPPPPAPLGDQVGRDLPRLAVVHPLLGVTVLSEQIEVAGRGFLR